MQYFNDYEEAYQKAFDLAEKEKTDIGLEQLGKQYRIWRLPKPQYRFGFEARCQVVKYYEK